MGFCLGLSTQVTEGKGTAMYYSSGARGGGLRGRGVSRGEREGSRQSDNYWVSKDVAGRGGCWQCLQNNFAPRYNLIISTSPTYIRLDHGLDTGPAGEKWRKKM